MMSMGPMLSSLLSVVNTHGLTLTSFDNTAFSGAGVSSLVAEPFAAHNGRQPFSARLTGILAVERGYLYNFSCSFGEAVLGYVHIDGHLVCQVGVNGPHKPTPSSVRSTFYDNPLPVLSSTAWPLRLAIVHNGSASVPKLAFGVNITRVRANGDGAGSVATPTDHPSWLAGALSPDLPPEERQRDALQDKLASGWGPWYDMSFTRLVRLPEGSALDLILCEPNSTATANTTAVCMPAEARVDWGPSGGAELRPGAHAYDRSFVQLFVSTRTCNVSLSYAGGDELALLAAVISGCDGAELLMVGASAWYRMHRLHSTGSPPSRLTFVPYGTGGLRTSTLYTSVAAETCPSLTLPAHLSSQPHLALPLCSGEIGISSGEPRSAADISSQLSAAWADEERRYAHFGEHAEAKMAVQAGVMWNVVYNPLERVIAPVIRGNPWGWDPATLNDDWPYVLFDWDTHFAAYMLSLDARELSYSVLIQIVKAKSARGFVANGWAPTRKSTHSQPPVGSKVLLEVFRRYGDAWLVRLLFDDLLDWSNWWHEHRRLAPLNMTVLGGDDMQAARYESGLDNSPMYDGDFFKVTEPDGYGLMELYDVGMGSMVAMSDECLAQLADVIGRADDAARLRARAAVARQSIDAHLWYESLGVYSNRRTNGSFYPRISPTSFYPMLAGAAPSARAASMVSGWLLNASRFCVSPHDFAGNHDDCYWGLPSIQRADPAFAHLGYWRGFVWGPMALLTYWGLAHPAYAHVAAVTTARAALCKQMGALLLSQWRRHRHICENFSPKRNATECTGMHFYHWGGLTGLIGLLEAGF